MGGAADIGAADFHLFETLLHTHAQGFFMLDGHVRRLRASVDVLGFRCPSGGEVRHALQAAAQHWPLGSASRVRLLLERDGTIRVERSPFDGVSTHPPVAMDAHGPTRTVRLDLVPTRSDTPELLHKTSRRGVYDAARARAGVCGGGCVGVTHAPFDVLMHNERGEVTECSIANIALELPDG